MGFDFNIISQLMYIMKTIYKPKQSNIIKLEKYLTDTKGKKDKNDKLGKNI